MYPHIYAIFFFVIWTLSLKVELLHKGTRIVISHNNQIDVTDEVVTFHISKNVTILVSKYLNYVFIDLKETAYKSR